MTNVKHILTYAIKMEEEGEKFYRDNLNKVKSKSTREILARLNEMEKEHVVILTKQAEIINSGGTWQPFIIGEKLDTIFQHRSDEESISDTELESELGDISVLRMAYLIEDDIARFYKKAAENISDSQGKLLFATLAEWEIEHRDMIYKEYMERFHGNWMDMGFAPF